MLLGLACRPLPPSLLSPAAPAPPRAGDRPSPGVTPSQRATRGQRQRGKGDEVHLCLGAAKAEYQSQALKQQK